jgi:5-methylthioadenosine/S-adenosylhomocysteine deaminase
MWPHPSHEVNEAIIQALEDSGVRAVFCRGVADRIDPERRWGFEPRLVEPLDDQLAHVEGLIARQAGSRVRIGLAPPNPRVLTPEAMRAVRELAERHELCVSVHLLETTLDEDAYREHERCGVVEFLDRHDFLWDGFLGVHCVNVSSRDRVRLAARRAGVSYNPVSNMRLGSGIAPIPELLAAGVPVGIGVDGAASNDTQDMLETLRVGAYLQRARLRDPAVLGAAEMIAMATDGANATIGAERRPDGVQPGMQADLVVLDFLSDLASVPVVDPATTLLTQASSRAVETVVVDGAIVIADGRSTRLDEQALIRDVQRLGSAEELAATLTGSAPVARRPSAVARTADILPNHDD